MNHMEFQRELNNRKIDPQTAYMLSLVFERMLQLSKDMDGATSIIAELANSVQSFANLHVHTQGQIKELLRRGRPDGVEVQSVRNDPEREH